MKKQLSFLMLLAALIVPWVTQAQSNCTPISTFPVTYGFEASEGFTTTVTTAAACTTNVFGTCWRNEQTTFNGTTGSGRIWHIYGGTTTTQIHSGAHSLMLPDKGSTSEGVSKTMLTFPAMDFTNPNGYVVSFWINRNATGTNPEGFKVYASPTDTIGPNAVLLGHYSRNYTIAYPCIEPASGWYQYETAPITLTGTVYIIFEGQSYYGNSTYIDDVVIMEAPTCPKPTSVVIDSLSHDAARITWQELTGNAGSFLVYYDTTPNINITTANYETTSDTAIILSDLEPMTTYYFVVVSDCGGGDSSLPTLEKNFTTLRNCGDDMINISDAVSNGTSSGSTYMAYNSTSYPIGHSANIFTTEEMIALGMEGPGTIHSISLHAGTTACTTPLRVYIGKTGLPEFNTATDTVGFSSMTMVFNGTLQTTAQEWVTIPFDTPFEYSPDSNLVIYFYRPGTPSASGTFYYTTTTPVYSTFYGYRSSTSTSNPTFTRSYLRVDVKFDICYEVPTCTRPSNITLIDASENSIELTWTGCDNADGYLVTYGPAGGTSTTEMANDNSIFLTDLVPGTTYDFAIRSVCGEDTTFAEHFSAATLCAVLNVLPYTQTFEGATAVTAGTNATFVDCMTRLNNGSTYFGYPYVGTTSGYNHTPGGTKGLYYYYPTTTGTYGDYACVVMPAVDTDTYEMNTLQVRFWARATGTSYHPVFQVGVMTDPDSINTFQLVQTVNVEGTAYTEYTVPFGTFTGYGQYVAIKAVRPSSAWYATVDDITIEEMPNCPPVTNLEAMATVGNALLTWDYQEGYGTPDGYEVTYDTLGGNGITVNVTEPMVTLTGLIPRSTYKVYVQADCGGDGYGLMDSIEFTTGPSSFIDLTQGSASTSYYLPIGNFYNYSYTQQLVTAAEMGGAATLTGIDFEYSYATAMSSKTNVTIYLANTTTSSLSSAFVTYNANTFVQVYSGNLNCTQGWNHFEFTTPFQYDGTSNLLIVVHDNSGSYNGNSYVFATYSAPSGMGRYVQNDSSPYTLSSITGGTAVAYRAGMHICKQDNSAVVTCANPMVMVTQVLEDSVTLAWIPGYNEDAWDVDYRVSGTTTWTNAATGVTATTYTVENLNPGTDYEFRVSFECDDDSSTVYSTTVQASTQCLQVAIPYTENFDNMAAGYGMMPNCWDYLLTGTSTYTTGTYLPGAYTSATYAHSGNNCLRLAGVGYHMLPEMSAPLDSLMISFYDYYTSASYGGIEVGVMEDGVFAPIASSGNGVNMTINTHNYIEVSFANYHGNSRTIALRNYYTTSTSTYYSYQYIDDIVVDYIPSCPHVTHLVVDSVSMNSVSLSWTAGGTESEWSVTEGENYYTTTDPYITITGLNVNTPYTFSVRALCDDDDSSYAMSIDTRTTCEPTLPLPYVEDFEGYTTSTTAATTVEVPCWGRLMTGTSSYQTGSYLPMIYYSTTYAHSGNYSLRLYGIGYHTLPQLPCPADSVTMGFWSYTTSSAYTLIVGVMSDPNNANTFDTVQVIDYPATSTKTYFEVDFSNYTGTGRYIAFRNIHTSYNYSYHYLDDIEVWHNTDCPAPVVSLGTVTNNSIQVSWVDTSDNSYSDGATIYWSTDNSINHAESAVVATGNSYTITGLTGGTDYWIWIAGNCSDELSRPQLLTATTLADCGVVENLTLNGVDYNSFGISWSAPTIGHAATSYVVYLRKCTNTPWAATASWIIDTTNNTYYIFNNLEAGTTYAYAVRTLCGAEEADYDGGYVTTTICEMDTVGDYATNFSVLPLGATGAYAYSQQIYHAYELTGIDSINSIAFYQRGYDYNDRKVTVYLGETSMNDFATTSSFLPLSQLTQVYSGMLSGFGWLNLKFDSVFVRHADSNLVVVVDDNTGVANPTTCYWACSNFGDQYYALYSYGTSDYNPATISSMTQSYYRNYIVFGNAACEPDECAVPIIVQTASSNDYVDILWNAVDGVSYDVYYRTLGDNEWTSVSTGNTIGTEHIAGLGGSFVGEVRVSYLCNGQEVNGTAQISTQCGTAGLPLIENFQSYDYGHFTRNCWITGLTNPVDADREYPYITALTGDENNMLCFMRYGAYVILPQVDTNLNECQIRFKLTQGNDDATLFIGVIDDVTMPIHTMHVLDTLTRYNYDTTSATASITYSFANIPAAYNHSRIAFWDGEESYSFLDDIVVELIPACTPASDFTVSAVTTNTATISWTTDGENATSYIIEYGPRGFVPGTGIQVTATGSPAILTGLDHSTNYDAYVYTVCQLLNSTSTASNVVQFTTDCAPYTTFPYTMNFENLLPAGSSIATVLPNCWASETGTNAVAHVVYTTTSTQASSPQHAFYMYENGVVALPEMGVPLNTLKLSFHEYNANPGSYGLVIGTVADANTGFAQTFVPYDTIDFTSNQNVYNVNCYFSDYTGTATHMAIKNYNTGTGTVSEHYIDDLIIDVAPSCIPPQHLHTEYVTNNEAMLAWNRSDAASYDVIYRIHGDTTFNTATTNTRSIVLTGLTPMSQYDVWVIGDCNDTVGISFTTLRAAPVTTYPYICDFADSAMAAAWSPINTADNGWYVGSNTYYGTADQRSLYVSNDQGLTNAYTITATTPAIYAYRTFTMNAGSYSIEFNWKAYGEGNFDYLRAYLVPANIELQAGIAPNGGTTSNGNATAAPQAGWIALGEKLNLLSSWQFFSEDVNVPANGNYNLVFYWGNDGSLGTQPPAAVDNVAVYINSCPKVDNLSAANVTDNSIDLSWTPTGNETEWAVSYNGVDTIVTDTTPALTGLTANTDYIVTVRPICGVDDTGRVRTITVHTPCSPVSLPYTENFDNLTTSTTAATGVQVDCWNYIMTGTATYQTATYQPQVYYSSTNANSGSYSLRLYGVSYTMLPPMPTSLDSLELTFSHYVTSTSYGLEVGVMEGTTFIPIETITDPTSTHVDHTVYFGTYTGNSRIIAFRNYYTTSTTTYTSYHYIDDIDVHYLPTCPRVLDVHATAASTTTISVDWVDQVTPLKWQIEYGAQNHTLGTGTTVTVYSHPYTIGGFDTLTSYDFYVRPICGAGDTGAWSIKATLSTEICDGAVAASTGTATGTANQAPVNNFFNYTLSQTIIDSAELAGIGTITSIAYSYAYATASTDKTNVDIWLQPTNKSTFSSTTDAVALNTATAVKVYHGALNCSQGWNYFTLDTTYVWDGHSNLLVIVDDNSGDYNGSAYTFNTSNCTGSKTLVYYSDSDNPNVTNPSAFTGNKYTYTWRPTMKLVSCGSGCPVPQVTNVDTTYHSITVSWTNSDSTEVAIVPGMWDETLATPTPVTPGTHTYTFDNLSSETLYSIGLRTLCEDNATSAWTVINVTTPELPCLMPTNVAAVPTVDGAVVTWTAGGNETAWTVRVIGHGDTIFQSVNTTPTVTLTGLYNNTDYTVEVKSDCDLALGIESDYTAPVLFHTLTCEMPTNVHTTAVYSTSATIEWTGTAEAYEVRYGFEITTSTGIVITTNTNSATLTGLDEDTEYDVYVRAICSAGNYSSWTAVYHFTTTNGSGPQPTYYTITVSANNPAWGTVTGGGTYEAGQTATLTATGNAGYHFVQWNDGNADSVRTITVTGNASYVATFAENGTQVEYYTVIVTSNNPDWGTVTGGGTVEAGSTITISARANAGYHFVEWNDHVTDSVRTITVTGNVTYTATFAQNEGIAEVNGANVTLYPNPASTMVTIDGIEGEGMVTVVDMNGRTVAEFRTYNTTLTIDLNGYAKGAYFVRITGERTNAIRKLIVK